MAATTPTTPPTTTTTSAAPTIKMAATKPAYETKEDFEEFGLAPYLTTTTKAESCSICLKDLACEDTGAAHKPLSKAERKLLDDEVDAWYHIYDINLPRDPHHHHNPEEQVGIELKTCGHIFGKTCIETWLEDSNSCPMCRKVLYPKQPKNYWF
ncbi:hypothetical protein ACET3X_001752 [Alternaria dauci]|uniref:RING-type domain-containing protein n=1 Tax=Alternaria dauci TaxID=48095 RepID=A0ABR3UZA6_9PLEO